MKYGFMLPSRGPLASPENLAYIAQRAEVLGYHLMMYPDHVVLPRKITSLYPYTETGIFPGAGPGDTMEQLTVLAFLAGQTTSIRLVPSVMIVPHRNPVVTAKALATLDVLSGGRVTVGVGVGWLREEFEALGVPPFEERGAVTDEYISVFKELWTSDNPHYEGKYCRFSDLSFLPKPVQKPHPPIWVGGESRHALRRAARLGDGWQPIGVNTKFPLTAPEQLAKGIQQLANYARQAGRNPRAIEVVARMHGYRLEGKGARPSAGPRPVFSGTAQEIASDIRRFEEMGVSYLVASFLPVAVVASSRDEMLGDMERLADRVFSKV